MKQVNYKSYEELPLMLSKEKFIEWIDENTVKKQ